MFRNIVKHEATTREGTKLVAMNTSWSRTKTDIQRSPTEVIKTATEQQRIQIGSMRHSAFDPWDGESDFIAESADSFLNMCTLSSDQDINLFDYLMSVIKDGVLCRCDKWAS